MNKLFGLTALMAASFAPAAQAHPHLFVGVEVLVVYQDGAPTGIQLTWQYDEFFSLLLTSDLGIDQDGDLELTASELEILSDAVANWPADFGGDLEVIQDGQSVRLGGRTDHTVAYEDGLISETHTRPVLPVLDATEEMTLRVYDPNYYVAYELNAPVQFSGRDDCDASILAPDLDAAYSLVEELLYGRPASDVGQDEQFPEVGVKFAETVTVSCAG